MSTIEQVREATISFGKDAAAGLRYDILVPALRALISLVGDLPEGEVREWLDWLLARPGYVEPTARLLGIELDYARNESVPRIEALLSSFIESSEMERFRGAGDSADSGRANDSIVVTGVVYARHGVDISKSVEVRLSGVPGRDTMLWRTEAFELSHPVAVAFLLCRIARIDRVTFIEKAAPKTIGAGPLDRYHPERFLTYHPRVRGLMSMVRNRNIAKGVTADEFNRIGNAVIRDLNAQVTELPHQLIEDMPRLGGAPANQAMSLGGHVLMWAGAGRQIYDLPSAMIERFRQTDVDDIPLSMLKFQYESLYLYWGPQRDLELEPGWCVDGAYVQSGLKNILQVLVTASPVDTNDSAWWPVKGEPYYYQAFKDESMQTTVGVAVDMALSKELNELKAMSAEATVDLNAMLGEMVASGEVDPDAAPRRLENVTARSAAQEIERLSRRYATYQQSLKLVINGLAYLTAYPEDSEPEYPPGAPALHVQATQSSDFKTARRARGKLAELG